MGIFRSIAKTLGFYKENDTRTIYEKINRYVMVKCKECDCEFSAPSIDYDKCMDCRWNFPYNDE